MRAKVMHEVPRNVVFRVDAEIDLRVQPEPEFVVVMIDSVFGRPRRGDIEVLTLLDLDRRGVGGGFGGVESALAPSEKMPILPDPERLTSMPSLKELLVDVVAPVLLPVP